MSRSRGRRVASAAAAVGAALLLSTATAGAVPSPRIGCGTVILDSVTLNDDVSGCAGDGLVVGADNVTLDLGGHSVSGTGTARGIVIAGSNVRVLNGSVRGFQDGVSATGWLTPGPLTGVELSRLRVAGNSRAGIMASYVNDATFEHNVVTDNGHWGMSMFELRGVVVQNTIIGNGADVSDAGGIKSTESGGLLRRNRVLANLGPGLLVQDPYALHISGNRANRNAADGVAIFENYPGYDRVVVSGNSANRNAGYGIWAAAQDWSNPPGLPTDGGGNSGWGNANPAQCLNIDCARNRGQARRETRTKTVARLASNRRPSRRVTAGR